MEPLPLAIDIIAKSIADEFLLSRLINNRVRKIKNGKVNIYERYHNDDEMISANQIIEANRDLDLSDRNVQIVNPPCMKNVSLSGNSFCVNRPYGDTGISLKKMLSSLYHYDLPDIDFNNLHLLMVLVLVVEYLIKKRLFISKVEISPLNDSNKEVLRLFITLLSRTIFKQFPHLSEKDDFNSKLDIISNNPTIVSILENASDHMLVLIMKSLVVMCEVLPLKVQRDLLEIYEVNILPSFLSSTTSDPTSSTPANNSRISLMVKSLDFLPSSKQIVFQTLVQLFAVDQKNKMQVSAVYGPFLLLKKEPGIPNPYHSIQLASGVMEDFILNSKCSLLSNKMRFMIAVKLQNNEVADDNQQQVSASSSTSGRIRRLFVKSSSYSYGKSKSDLTSASDDNFTKRIHSADDSVLASLRKEETNSKNDEEESRTRKHHDHHETERNTIDVLQHQYIGKLQDILRKKIHHGPSQDDKTRQKESKDILDVDIKKKYPIQRSISAPIEKRGPPPLPPPRPPLPSSIYAKAYMETRVAPPPIPPKTYIKPLDLVTPTSNTLKRGQSDSIVVTVHSQKLKLGMQSNIENIPNRSHENILVEKEKDSFAADYELL